MSDPHLLQLGVAQRLRRALLELALGALALGHALGAHDHAGLDDLLEQAQVVHDLGARRGARQLLDELADPGAGPARREVDMDLRAAVSRGPDEADGRVGVLDVRGTVLGAVPQTLHLVHGPVDRDRRLLRGAAALCWGGHGAGVPARAPRRWAVRSKPTGRGLSRPVPSWAGRSGRRTAPAG